MHQHDCSFNRPIVYFVCAGLPTEMNCFVDDCKTLRDAFRARLTSLCGGRYGDVPPKPNVYSSLFPSWPEYLPGAASRVDTLFVVPYTDMKVRTKVHFALTCRCKLG